ncbi:MAG: polysaccharide biosynthesis protein [Reichenbachiella sp.]|uniref:polysaccharide biosynthesis protein n=1 Tax=Reichenbachiella sp. TaxID=2184521 RepID=UPI0032632047
MVNNKSIFITGGTGTLGQSFIKKVLNSYSEVGKITIYSRDEMKQYELGRLYPSNQYPQIRWVIGDVRDRSRLVSKMAGADIVIHAAAMKHIPICEENPEECIKTNVEGTKNVIFSALENGVKKTVLCSTDKAVDPISIYGNSKEAAEKLFLNASTASSKFAIIRLGNIWGSRGSVVPLFKELSKTGVIPITHPDMTRFFCSESQTTDSLIYALEHMLGGEIFIPKMSSRRIVDIAKEIGPDCAHHVIGLRGFEKISEKLITDTEKERTIENSSYWIVHHNKESVTDYDQLISAIDQNRLDSQLANDAHLKYQLN